MCPHFVSAIAHLAVSKTLLSDASIIRNCHCLYMNNTFSPSCYFDIWGGKEIIIYHISSVLEYKHSWTLEDVRVEF